LTSALLLFKTLWGWADSLDKACECSHREGFDGLEVNLDHPCLEAVPAAATPQEQSPPATWQVAPNAPKSFTSETSHSAWMQ